MQSLKAYKIRQVYFSTFSLCLRIFYSASEKKYTPHYAEMYVINSAKVKARKITWLTQACQKMFGIWQNRYGALLKISSFQFYLSSFKKIQKIAKNVQYIFNNILRIAYF